MSGGVPDDPAALASRAVGAVPRGGAESPYRVRRVVVLASAGSTQDEAALLAAGDEQMGVGLMVVAARQTGGRGRLGRTWADTGDAGLAVTFVVGGEVAPSRIAIAAGVASCDACAAALPAAGVGIRWPNDVVEATAEGPGRKLSGVLVERRGAVLLVGVGVNVSQRAEDWSGPLAGRAVSLHELGSGAGRSDVAVSLAVGLTRRLGEPCERVHAAWRGRNVLLGLRCEFESDGARIAGVVEGIDPANAVIVRTDRGDAVTLAAEATTLVGVGRRGHGAPSEGTG